MKLVDTHTHLYLPDFKEDLEEVIRRSKERGIERAYLPNIDLPSLELMDETVQADSEFFRPMVGLHPCSVGKDHQSVLDQMEKILEEKTDYYVGIGETGIDLYWDKTYVSEQRDAFARQIHWGMEHQKPVIIHVRNSFDEVFDVLQNEIDDRFFGILHCFTGGKRHMVKALDLNLHLGIGGIVTFDQGLPFTVRKTPIERIVLETDSPYLAPAPHRGARNETAYMYHVTEKVADIYGLSVEEIADITTRNANQLFGEHE